MKEWIWEDSDDGYVSTRKQELVRCKDCKFKQDSSVAGRTWWCNRLEKHCDDDWFCADGERKET